MKKWKYLKIVQCRYTVSVKSVIDTGELKNEYAKELDKRGIFYKGMAYTDNLEEGETAGNYSKYNTGVKNGEGSY